MTDTRKWSALAAVLVVAIFAAGWFLLISPKRGDAAELREQGGHARRRPTPGSSEQITMLQAQQKDLPQQQAQLAAMRTQIPDNPALPSLIRDLTAAGQQGRRQHRLDGAVRCRWRWCAAPARHGRADDHRYDRHDRIDRHDRTTATPPKHAAAPTLDAVPGAADAERDRQLLRAGAVPQQAREPPALVPGQSASRSSRGVHDRTRSRRRPHDRPRRSGVPQPAHTATTTTPVVAPATGDQGATS